MRRSLDSTEERRNAQPRTVGSPAGSRRSIDAPTTAPSPRHRASERSLRSLAEGSGGADRTHSRIVKRSALLNAKSGSTGQSLGFSSTHCV